MIMVDYTLKVEPGRLWTPGPDGLAVVPVDMIKGYIPEYADRLQPGDRVFLNPATQKCLVENADGKVLYRQD